MPGAYTWLGGVVMKLREATVALCDITSGQTSASQQEKLRMDSSCATRVIVVLLLEFSAAVGFVAVRCGLLTGGQQWTRRTSALSGRSFNDENDEGTIRKRTLFWCRF